MREMDGEVSIGPFRLDLAHGRLIRDGVVRDLRPQAFRALKVLVRYRGNLVDYPQLIREAWDVHVSKHTVATTINELKNALDEYGAWITCRAKIGYCLEVPASNELMRQGWHYWNQYTRAGFESALKHFEGAARANPTDFRAYEAIASTYLMLAGFLMRAPSEMHASFIGASVRALSLAGPTVTLSVDRAFGLCVFERRLRDAESELLVLRPEHLHSVHIQVRLAIILLASGRLEEARTFMVSAKATDPLAPELAFLEIIVRLFSREFEEAVECGRRSVDMHPSAEIGRAFYAEALDFAGRHAEAVHQYRLAIGISPETGWIRADLARCLALAGEKTEALNILDDLRRWRETNYIDAYHMALLLDALGCRELALCEIERAFRENSYALLFSVLDAKADSLRSDARFERIHRQARTQPADSQRVLEVLTPGLSDNI